MILQSLVDYYETLAAKGEIAPLGWGRAKASYALNLSDQGQLLGLIPLKQSVPRGKKTVEVPQEMTVPEPVIRGVNVAANFLCDHAGYFFGIDNKGKPERTLQCVTVSRELHLSVLERGTGPAARAVIRFFESWDPSGAVEHPVLQPYLEELRAGAYLVFYTGQGRYAHEDEEIRQLWNDYYQAESSNPVGRCLVTGKRAPIALLHGKIKGVPGAQMAGANLVSFNANAYESYGHDGEQGLNAPVSEYANFAYSTVLNHLLADYSHRVVMGDTVLVYWSRSANPIEDALFGYSLDPGSTDWMQQTNDARQDENQLLDSLFKKLMRGENVDEIDLEDPFFVLGLAPNAARLSVRFFLQNSFGGFINNLKRHYDDLQMVKAPYERAYLSVPALLRETVNLKSKDKVSSPLLTGSVLRAILSGQPYPEALYLSVLTRVRAEQDDEKRFIKKVTRGRAAIIKAYLKRNADASKQFGEVLSVALNEQSNNRAYVLGRLFAVLERAQMEANPGINTTIKDRYFTSACATPGNVFPVLLRLASHHTAKSEYGKNREIEIGRLMDKLDVAADPIPSRLSLKEQGVFILGYYQQVQDRYTGSKNKEEK